MDSMKIGLNGNKLKIIAALSMTADHIGYMLLPEEVWLRAFGRLAFPLFAFFIFQGARYTHNKLKYLSGILGLGLLCVFGYYLYCGEIYTNALITFSLSICILYSINFFRKSLRENNSAKLFISCGAIIFSVLGTYFICKYLKADYGFPGAMLAVSAELSTLINIKGEREKDKKFALIGFAIGLIWLSCEMGGKQWLCLFSLPLLLLYDGTRGKLNMKYFFYWFYPVHLMAIGTVSMFL
ncbi:MAG: conjugal transfer protein TraX [Clostridiales bacterium]|nr:conjugal transfer protein TraX [Clostridiales bacterium]